MIKKIQILTITVLGIVAQELYAPPVVRPHVRTHIEAPAVHATPHGTPHVDAPHTSTPRASTPVPPPPLPTAPRPKGARPLSPDQQAKLSSRAQNTRSINKEAAQTVQPDSPTRPRSSAVSM